jgi:hypothetical protein
MRLLVGCPVERAWYTDNTANVSCFFANLICNVLENSLLQTVLPLFVVVI